MRVQPAKRRGDLPRRPDAVQPDEWRADRQVARAVSPAGRLDSRFGGDMPIHVEPPQSTFVIRFWREWQGGDVDQPMGWRGRVEHVQSGEGMAFREVRELLAFIERFIAPLSSPTRDGRM